MLCDRIMDLSQYLLVAIFSVFSIGVPAEATPRGSKKFDRRDGYDLRRGPVFYEAYYPDYRGPASATDRQPSPLGPQTPRRYFDGGDVFEKTHRQPLEDSRNDISHESASSRSDRERLLTTGNYKVRDYPRHESSYSVYVGDSGGDRAYEVARQLKRFVEGLERDSTSPRINDPNIRDFEDSRSGYNDVSETRLDDYTNVILSAVKREVLEFYKGRPRDVPPPLTPDDTEENLRVSRQQRFVDSEDSFHRPQTRDVQGNLNTIYRSAESRSVLPEITAPEDRHHFFDKTRFSKSSALGDEYRDDARGPISRMNLPRMENIFQPRPQVISYVFGPTRTPTERSILSADQPLEKYGDHPIEKETRKETKISDGLGVASIEVSEVPRHKIRHRHGEKPRRNDQRRTTANTDRQ